MPDLIDYNTIDITVLLSDRTVQRLLDIAERYPEWSIQQMVDSLPKTSEGKAVFTYNQARSILGRLRLSTPARRSLRTYKIREMEYYEQTHQQNQLRRAFPELLAYFRYKQTQKQGGKVGELAQPDTAIPKVSLYTAITHPIAFTPAQRSTFKSFDRFFGLVKQFAFTALLSFLFFFAGSLVFDTIFRAHTLLARIGMFFAFSALTCGTFFFLYSLKYYLTIAVILSFSRSEHEETDEGKGIGGFLSRLFGFSITVENAPPQPARKPAVSLRLDLSQVQLERTPFVSMHVATYNEKRVIDRFLLAATSMEYPNYEVIVADDSTDETAQLLEQWKAHPQVKISHRNSRVGYKGGALQKALEVTDPRAEFILVFDADFIPYPDAIVQFLKYFQAMLGDLRPETIRKSHIASVQGYQWHVLNKSENWITRGVRTEYAGSYVIERSGTEVYQGLKQISGSVYMIRKDLLQTIGWGRSITEDFELTLRLYEKGYKVVYTPYVQAPAEAVSTIKRLIRQRMRWAEGHSFNVKRMFRQLLFSPRLSRSEKFEFLYLAPYYLQAFIFIVGMLSWFTSEIIFQVGLPFWTETWGWSLVFTNLFALPLMNLVGLFMESSEERDYLGLVSFVILSYIVAPFQAFAAVKGFVEREEGPWFRTPKTGRITDNFTAGKFYRFLKGMLGSSPQPLSVATSSFSSSPTGAFSDLALPDQRISMMVLCGILAVILWVKINKQGKTDMGTGLWDKSNRQGLSFTYPIPSVESIVTLCPRC
jgi:cellulose synthase/poly-beta-1,6-N-acetylglucosamine synthase-like glycosyltransferase